MGLNNDNGTSRWIKAATRTGSQCCFRAARTTRPAPVRGKPRFPFRCRTVTRVVDEVRPWLQVIYTWVMNPTM